MATKQKPSIFQRIGWQKLLFESFLIIFSILFALFINEWRKNQELGAQRQKALQMVIGELEHNLEELEYVIPYHRQSAIRLDSVSQDAGQMQQPLFGVTRGVLERGILPAELQTTAWNTAQLSGAVSLFDEQTIYALAGVYELQSHGVENTWKEIAEFYLSTDNFDSALTQRRITMLVLYFQELASQEEFLLRRTKEAIAALQQQL